MVSFPPCKINLGLNVIRKRPDGYHDISTCFYPVQWNDMLEIIPSHVMSFTTSGNAIPGNDQENLCLKAYRLLSEEFRITPVKIHLHKAIPIGGGLGGGSSDAAFALTMLNEIFELKLDQIALTALASKIGSDCAFFIQEGVMMGSGRGELLTPCKASLKNKFLVLVKPDIHVSTSEAYAGVKPRQPQNDIQKIIERIPPENWKDVLKNDFERSVFDKYPVIGEVKRRLYDAGALYASMSGSGAAVYGIFSSAMDLTNQFSSMQYWSGMLTV
jgi:4-diphosphocytidyl-2-C-methyl-D-erythritol kinase